MPLGNHEMLSEAGVEHHLGLIAICHPGDLDALNLGVLQNLAEKIPKWKTQQTQVINKTSTMYKYIYMYSSFMKKELLQIDQSSLRFVWKAACAEHWPYCCSLIELVL